MSIKQFKAFLSGFGHVDNVILDKYVNEWKVCAFPRRTIMTAPGEVQRYWYFVADGIQKSYYINNDKQHVMAFTYAPSFTGIPESFFRQEPSQYFLETITDSIFLRISYARHQLMMKEHREIETLFRKLTEHLLIGILERYYELMAYDIQTRFRSFTKRSPHLLNMISQKDLASYLRIDPTNFSKLINAQKI